MIIYCASAVVPACVPLPTRAVHPFAAARAFTHQQGLLTAAASRAWARTSAHPADIRARPDVVYKGCGWCSWYDWLGTTLRSRTWRPFPEARAHAQGLHLAGARAWRACSHTGAPPRHSEFRAIPTKRTAGPAGVAGWVQRTGRPARAVCAPFARRGLMRTRSGCTAPTSSTRGRQRTRSRLTSPPILAGRTGTRARLGFLTG